MVESKAAQQENTSYRPPNKSAGLPPKTSVLQLRAFVRHNLKDPEVIPGFVQAVVEYADATFYSDRFPENRPYNEERAQKGVDKLGLSVEDQAKASITAATLYQAYTYLVSPQQDKPPLTPEALGVIERRLQEEREAKQKEREAYLREQKEDKKQFLIGRFQRLISLSDDELTIHNANMTKGRIDFKSDPVFSKSSQEIKDKMKQRTLTVSEYEAAQDEIYRRENSVALNIDGITHFDLLYAWAARALENDLPLQHKLGDNYEALFYYVLGLLQGESILKDDISLKGLDPKIVARKAHTLLASFRFNYEKILANPPEESLRLRGYQLRHATDPHGFLDDGSGRRYLGYIQNLPKD